MECKYVILNASLRENSLCLVARFVARDRRILTAAPLALISLPVFYLFHPAGR